MITFHNVSKIVRLHGHKRVVLSEVNGVIPSDRRIAFLRPHAHDMLTFVNLLAGITLPTAGRIVRRARVSFPVGYIGGFTNELSVRQNVAHVARLYDADVDAVVEFVARTGKFGRHFDMPFRDLPGPQKIQLATLTAYGIPFDLYLLTAEFNRGKGLDKKFVETVSELFAERARTAGMFMIVNNPDVARQHCDMGLILHRGQLLLFDDVEAAIAAREALPAEQAAAKRPQAPPGAP
jgi:capsular polysaccharide transport system ATP-binding protein